MRTLFILCLLLSVRLGVAAVEYHDFADPQQEQAYQSLITELRCLVCQNQTIADSNADLAKDLRRQVYEMVRQGQTKQQIADFMTQRYGDFVLYKPVFSIKTALLWLGPGLFLLIGLLLVLSMTRRKHNAATALNQGRRQELQQLLEKDGE